MPSPPESGRGAGDRLPGAESAGERPLARHDPGGQVAADTVTPGPSAAEEARTGRTAIEPDRGAAAATDLLDTYAAEEATDRRRRRRALVAAAAGHLLLLAIPLPSFRPPAGDPGGEHAVFVLQEVRFAPPRAEPEPLPPPEPEVVEPEVDEPGEGRLGPPPVEVLFAESELSRLVPPQAVSAPPPPYPPEARAAGVAGEVILRLQLDAAGEILDVRVEEGPPELAEPARQAALGWRFLPGTLDGVPIPVVVEVRVRFTPPED